LLHALCFPQIYEKYSTYPFKRPFAGFKVDFSVTAMSSVGEATRITIAKNFIIIVGWM
jgi:hypothetical protein